jgi:hypothetical protein
VRDVRYRYLVTQEVVTYVWAPNSDGAMYRSAHVVMGPRWQHIRLLRWVPWARKPVKSVGGFHIEKLSGVR